MSAFIRERIIECYGNVIDFKLTMNYEIDVTEVKNRLEIVDLLNECDPVYLINQSIFTVGEPMVIRHKLRFLNPDDAVRIKLSLIF